MNALLTSAYPTLPARPVLSSLLGWQEPLATRLRYRHDLPGQLANRMLNVELGLFVLGELLPSAPPEALSDLLNGEGMDYEDRPVWTPKQYRQLSRARALLAPYKDRDIWFNALTKYATLPTWLRVFLVSGRGGWNMSAGNHTLLERQRLFLGALA